MPLLTLALVCGRRASGAGARRAGVSHGRGLTRFAQTLAFPWGEAVGGVFVGECVPSSAPPPLLPLATFDRGGGKLLPHCYSTWSRRGQTFISLLLAPEGDFTQDCASKEGRVRNVVERGSLQNEVL